MALLLVKALALVALAGANDVEFIFRLSKWGACSDSCGAGVQTRELECFVLLQGANSTKRMRKVNNIGKCTERKVPLPTGWRELNRTCTGITPPTSFCAECPVAEEGCRRCASGFEFDQNGYCRNLGLEVLVDLVVPEPFSFEWQQDWSPSKLTDCAKALVDEAAGEAESRVRVYAVAPKSATRRKGGASDRVIFRAAASVPQGAAAYTIREAIQANFSRIIDRRFGFKACPRKLKLRSASILCPDARSPDSQGLCNPVVRQVKAMAISTWCVFALFMLVVGVAVFCAWEPEYRKREATLEMRSQSDMTGR